MPLEAVRPEATNGLWEIDCDTVIVGSGASGAVTAATIAAAGRSVVILEEGKYVRPQDYGNFRPSQSLRHIWREGAVTAAFGIGDSPVINVTMGRCVGGSSVLTGGVCFRTPESVLRDWRELRGLREFTPEHMDPYFQRVEERVHVETVPENMRSRSTTLFDDGAKKLGFSLRPIRRNTKDCNGCGRCNFGCPHGAKLSVDVTYLVDAVASGAKIFAGCLVKRVTTQGSKATAVEGELIDEFGHRRGKFRVRAKNVVLAAGAAHTPMILSRSGLGGVSSQLGRNLTLHPSFRVTARFKEPVFGWRGALQSAFSTEFEHEKITLVSVFVPPAAVATGIPGIGPQFMERTADFPHLAMFGGLVHDEGGGRVVPFFGREPLMLYRMMREDRKAVSALIRKMAEVYFAAGAVEVFLPILGHPSIGPDDLRHLDLDKIPGRLLECSSQHPLGTCRMGPSAESSVVDGNGKVWATDNLYIVDGGVLPTSLGVNPQLSIMAMALRLASRMV